MEGEEAELFCNQNEFLNSSNLILEWSRTQSGMPDLQRISSGEPTIVHQFEGRQKTF